ncbi:helix-turn-helix domain-containing protein [Streptomyces barkulensis]|uniref:helix-turn-helix domain-containing protein n=1 Tax=Streptomyces barkulensis TaxID=1257026 RepID=UPI000C6CF1B3|nr:helix-turn-helix transcriptional regulator [Streptomyces barkulensis]
MPGKELDPSAGPAEFFGAEVRHRREERDWSQRELGVKANISPSRIAQIELASIPATLHNATALDVALETGGLFARLFALMDSTPAFPDWVQRYMRMEAAATAISGYAPMVVPGLLQTEDYARAILRAGRPRDSAEEVERRVHARLGRQEVLGRAVPPALWYVVEEELLRRPVGGRDVMAAQLGHLVTLVESRTIVLQVLPTSVGAHAALGGTLTLLSRKDGPAVAYVEGPFTGQLCEESDQVTELSLAYDHLQATALSHEESLAVIREAMEDMR